ncbi:MAG: dephospho-CoA kinase [Kiritimatiellae bacterium]|jgi:dephospho-CoA kinase|nr:dephospho-CoA kinase [Kiritimatiellia bacterium]
MKRVCITGGIACGKSSAGEIWRKAGARILDADGVCHELLRHDRPLINRIASVFGRRVLGLAGGIDRSVLGRIVFNDRDKLRKLNGLVHPCARRAINAWLNMLPARAGFAAVIIPLAYEAGWERGWDAVVCVAAPLNAQVARLKKKGFTEKDARARIAAQMPLAEKMNRADYVIFNAGTVAGLRQQAKLVFRHIKEKTEKRYERKR